MKRFNYNMSKSKLLSCDMGELVPIDITEIVQGDIWDMSTEILIRFSPLLAPVMHPTHVYIHKWFIPHRIGMKDFPDVLTGGPAGTSNPTWPTITLPNSGAGGVVAGSLADYLGVPLGYNADNSGYTVSALPFRAYAQVYNFKYRDQDLQTAVGWSDANGNDVITNTSLLNACWGKDYFTAARPSPQKGAPVSLPLGTTAAVVSDGSVSQVLAGTNRDLQLRTAAGGTDVSYTGAAVGVATPFVFGSNTGLEADLTTASAADVSDLRLAAAVQRALENGSRFGSRLYEYLRRFGIKFSDASMQIPQYLGGGMQVIQYSEVLQTAEGSDPVGTLRGHGIAAARSNRVHHFFEEPGYVLTLAYVVPKTMYTQGLERHWNRRTRFDFWQPETEFIGQQNILNKEVYAPHTTPEGTFGWQNRFDELRSAWSAVCGEFRTSALNFYHFARSFSASPTLNGDFVKAVPTDVPFAVPSEDVMYFMCYHKHYAKRFVSGDPSPKLK